LARFHGKKAADAAEAEFEQRFRHGVLPDSMPEVKVVIAGAVTMAQVLKLAGLAESTSEANRLIEQGGVKVDGERLSDRALKAERGKSYVIQGRQEKGRAGHVGVSAPLYEIYAIKYAHTHAGRARTSSAATRTTVRCRSTTSSGWCAAAEGNW